ncbi:unnamed protein product [Pocillopora meandrina]|uniref:Uncharacterized protein n=1 Tax=Pocillopora meandrina TaxID=46732 RepID=A0AAU9VS46_9CNID|nr:unnamed protein product [Pocillopora meandrina]
MLMLSRLCSFEERLNYFGSIHNRHGLPPRLKATYSCLRQCINFVGRSKELKELKALDKREIQDATTSYGVNCHFNPLLHCASVT